MGDSSIRDGRKADAASTAPDARRADDASAFRFKEGQDRRESESIPDLIRDLVHQGSHLADKQIELVQAEMRSGLRDLKESAGAMAGAAVLGIAGIGVTLMGAAYVLNLIMPMWLATLIVGVAALIGAYALFKGAQDKLEAKSVSMDRTRRTLERAPGAISGEEESEASHGR